MKTKPAEQMDSKKEAKQSARAKELVTLDYPQEGERVAGPDYTFRISAPKDAQHVELCLDRSPWRSCRQAGGFWWFDCSDLAQGVHQARARMHANEGKMKMTLLRRFQGGQ